MTSEGVVVVERSDVDEQAVQSSIGDEVVGWRLAEWQRALGWGGF
jgi:hypothetical protein